MTPSSACAPLRVRLPRWWLIDTDAAHGPLTHTFLDAFVLMMLGPP